MRTYAIVGSECLFWVTVACLRRNGPPLFTSETLALRHWFLKCVPGECLMHLLLLAMGVLVTAVGVVMLAFSVPLTDPAGVALFTSGTIAAVGGFILVGLSAAVRSLSRIAERLDIQPLPLPALGSIETHTPPPRPIPPAPDPPTSPTAPPFSTPRP